MRHARRWARIHTRIRERRERRRERRYRRRNPLLGGLMLIAVGLVLLLELKNVRVGDTRLGFETLWPVFLIVLGPAMLLGFLFGGLREPERVAGGVTTALLGWFFLAITLGPLDFDQMQRLWPAFPLAAGIGSFAGWMASLGRRLELLRGGVVAGLVGVVGFAFTLTDLGTGLLTFGWPLLLVLLGFALLLRAVLTVVLRLFAGRVSAG